MRQITKYLIKASKIVQKKDPELAKLLIKIAQSTDRTSYALADLETVVHLRSCTLTRMVRRVDAHEKLLKQKQNKNPLPL